MRFSLIPCVGLVSVVFTSAAQTPSAASDATLDYTVEQHDTLIWLGKNLLVAPSAWREVARINQLPDPDYIVPGQRLRIPMRLLRSTDVPATLLTASGDVRVDGKVPPAGAAVNLGQTITTAESSSAILQLGDNSRVKVMPATETVLGQNRRYQIKANRSASPAEEQEGLFASTMRLVRGSVDMAASKVPRAKPLEVTTPTAVIGVRGTEYRVHHEGDGAEGITRTEVLSGKVQADFVTSGKPGLALNEGFGAVMSRDTLAPAVTALPDAPELPAFTQLFDRPVVRFKIQDEALPLRVQVAEDPQFDRIIKDQRVAQGGEVQIAGLPDGTWHVRVRRVVTSGLEGRDARGRFVVDIRPEPPIGKAPAQGAKVPLGEVAMAWTANTAARSYRLQVAKDAEFTRLVKEMNQLVDTQTRLHFEEAGLYHWRLASVRANGDSGAWGNPMRFEVKPHPANPEGGLSEDGRQIQLRWKARPEDRHHAELSRNPEFTEVIAQADLAQSEWAADRPIMPGTYYFRYRSIEPDGYVSSWSSTLQIEVPRDWRFLWYFAPFLLGL